VIPVSEAQTVVVEGCNPLEPRAVALDDARGCVLAAAVVAPEDVPPFENSAMDGYALLAADTRGAPVTLKVVGSLLAGQHRDEPVGPGEAVRIMTGAPIPPGADAVCMIEHTHSDDGDATVVIESEVPAGTAVRPRADDIAAGDLVFDSGTYLTPAHIGVLAGLGATEVHVHPRVRVGVISTGDELTESPGPLRPGQIRDANRHSLLALLRDEGFAAVDLGIVGDDEAALRASFAKAHERCDAVLTSGGVSVGDRDLVKEVLRDASRGSMRWMQVAVRPAKPFAFGVLADSGIPVFGLPGNPVSSLVSFALFARPGLRRLGGHRELFRAAVRATAEVDFERRADGKLHLVSSVTSVASDGTLQVRPAGTQGSHRLRTMADANALVHLPDGPTVPGGQPVSLWLLRPPSPAVPT
jgi:molybdenum cofactor synthesis domain-containing protein